MASTALAPDPLPFRLGVTGRDTVGADGIESVSYRVNGTLRLEEGNIVLEWTGTRTLDRVSLDGIGTDVIELPVDRFELPIERIAGMWVIGGWWAPRLELRARAPEDLDGVPATRGVTLRLRIRRRDRTLARAVASEIAAHRLEVPDGEQ
jgi:hypothetical protein